MRRWTRNVAVVLQQPERAGVATHLGRVEGVFVILALEDHQQLPGDVDPGVGSRVYWGVAPVMGPAVGVGGGDAHEKDPEVLPFPDRVVGPGLKAALEPTRVGRL